MSYTWLLGKTLSLMLLASLLIACGGKAETVVEVVDVNSNSNSATTLEQPPEIINLRTNASWKSLVQSTRLPNLDQEQIRAGDLEIRIWELPGLVVPKTKCWVFSRKNGKWTAFALVDPNFKGTITRKVLNTPQNGSAEWASYVENNLLPLKVRESQPVRQRVNDAIEVIIEVKAGDDYAKNLYDDNKLLTQLFNMIKVEFLKGDDSTWSGL